MPEPVLPSAFILLEHSDVLSDHILISLPFVNILVAVVSFSFGVVVGWVLSEDVDFVTRTQLQRGIAILITIVWTTSVIADILLMDYSTPLVLYGIMGAVAGFLFKEDGLTIDIGKD